MKKARILLLLAAFAGMPVFAAKPQIQWDPNYDFSAVRTFQWKPTPAISLRDTDPFLHSRIVNAIEYELTAFGLTEVENDPDVYVTYHSTTETNTRLTSTSVGYSFGRYGLGGWRYYGYGVAGPIVTSTTVTQVERGALVVDVVDARTDQLVWRGTVKDITVSDSPQTTQRNVVTAIERMAKQYRKLRAREN